MPIGDQDRLALADLLITEEQNVPTLLQLARSVTRNVLDIAGAEEALDLVCTHIEDTAAVLQKRLITKEILFRYLHKRKVVISSDFTKGTLIQKVLEYWQSSFTGNHSDTADAVCNNPQNAVPSDVATVVEQYPIHLLAHKFCEWFFENYNKGNLKPEDFWPDVYLKLRIMGNDSVNDNECMGADGVIASLMQSKNQFGFYFNPNLTHAGAQGRMDVHGSVLALVCGTLHSQANCVGVFECTFGLLRDPFAENNWKMKTIKCILRSQGVQYEPSLYDSETLQEELALPVPMGELT